MTDTQVPFCCTNASCGFRGASTERDKRLPRLVFRYLDIEGRYNFCKSCSQSFRNSFLRGKSSSKTHGLIGGIIKGGLFGSGKATVHEVALLVCQ